MAAAGYGGPVPDLYQLLGVSRGASGGEVTQAWRRQALAEHPDRRPRDAAAPARFRALAEAYQVLGDPARRAAYDQSLRDHGAVAPEGPPAGARAGWRPGFRVPVAVRGRPGGCLSRRCKPGRSGWTPRGLRRRRRSCGQRRIDAVRLAALAVRYLAGDWDWPW